ncbi:hypothetical protein BOX15_Mlig027475g2 [Macrostomum lignano]|uniref:receptor protein-tyrosine kinase n=2 Tax=Macrostomum lignano TaxID=282301 RepID=A0A267EBJ2_9PLAT|nr:hypothetical protein BOX15_Mlig027475g2 [Macrostomum lignano]
MLLANAMTPLLLLLLILPARATDLKICKSVELTQGNFEQHRNTGRLYRELKARVSNCQYIHGDLTIKNIGVNLMNEALLLDTEVRNMSTDFLDSIEEISGRLLVFRVNLRVLRLASLRAIRGYNQLGESPYYPLEIRQSPYPMQLQLPSLGAILQGSVLLSGELHEILYCHLTRSVAWNELFKSASQRLQDRVTAVAPVGNYSSEVRLNTSDACLSGDPQLNCHGSCKLDVDRGQRICWSAGPNGCQSSSRCSSDHSGCGSCFQDAGREACCDSYCLGGCSSRGRSACFSCRDVSRDGKCENACPTDYDPGKGVIVSRNDSTLQVGNICVRTCPPGFQESSDSRFCLSECPVQVPGDDRRRGELPVNGICRPCERAADCRACRLSAAIFTDAEADRLRADGCPVWQASELQPMLDVDPQRLSNASLQVLGQLRYLYGNFVVKRVKGSLDFLTNLTFVSGNLGLMMTNTPYLGLASLQSAKAVTLFRVSGLCQAWYPAERINKLRERFEISEINVSFDNTSAECAKAACHPQCTGGCWGPGRRLCVACLRYRVNDSCYADCKEAHRFAWNATACGAACHAECKIGFGCSGPGPADCVSCRRFNESGVCVSECSRGHRPDSNGRCYSVMVAVGICLGVGLLLLLTASLPLAVLYYRRRITRYEAVDLDEYLRDASNPSDMVKLLIVNDDDVSKQRVIGTGAFGTVFKGMLRSHGRELPVAVKVLRGRSPKLGQELLKEAGVLARVRHPCCIRLVALCLTQEPQLITALMPRGCLLDFVRERRRRIGANRMLHWALQVAEGMAYLQSEGIVHRDLAARNVLLQTPDQVRITDFGLARLLNISERDFASRGGLLPMKWLGLECIESGLFSHQSDVWSYGVLLWEVCTFGESPYCQYGIRSAEDMLGLLRKGIRLGQPDVCSVDFYNILLSCWLPFPESRPSFSDLTDTMKDCLKAPEKYIAYNAAGTREAGGATVAASVNESDGDGEGDGEGETETTMAATVVAADADVGNNGDSANAYITDPVEKRALLEPELRDPPAGEQCDDDDGYLVPCSGGQPMQPMSQQQQQHAADCDSDPCASSCLLPKRK